MYRLQYTIQPAVVADATLSAHNPLYRVRPACSYHVTTAHTDYVIVHHIMKVPLLAYGAASTHIPSPGLCRYEVRKKKMKFDLCRHEIAEEIVARFLDQHGRVQCGIVYCLSKNDCEKVAAELQSLVNDKNHKSRHRCTIRYRPL